MTPALPIAILLTFIAFSSGAQELVPHSNNEDCFSPRCQSTGLFVPDPLGPIPNPGPPANICVVLEGYCILLGPEHPGAACSCFNSQSGFPIQGRAFYDAGIANLLEND